VTYQFEMTNYIPATAPCSSYMGHTAKVHSIWIQLGQFSLFSKLFCWGISTMRLVWLWISLF